MSSHKRLKKKLKRIFKPTIGKLFCFMMLAYFVFTGYQYSTKVSVSYYEVEEGSLVKEHKYNGLILRDEQIFNSEGNGYIYYYVAEGRKAAKGSPIYSIDENGGLMSYISKHSDELNKLNSDKIADIRAEVLNASRSFNAIDFRSIYNIKNTLDAHVTEYASMNIFSSLADELAAAGVSYKQFNSDMTGIFCSYTDGFEALTESDINIDLFDTSKYDKQTVKSGDLVTVGSPAYKLIVDENWKIVFPVTDEDIAEFGNDSTVKINFSDKDFSVKCKLRIIKGTDGRQFGVLDLDSYVIQFTSDRFINFEIVTNDVSGLKIPDKSITSKDFYVVPASYLCTDSNGNQGFYKAVVSGDGTSAQFVMPEIFNLDDDYAYIDCDDEDDLLKPGDYVMPGPDYSASVSLPTKQQAAGVPNESESELESESQSLPVESLAESVQTDTESEAGHTESEAVPTAEESEAAETQDESKAAEEDTQSEVQTSSAAESEHEEGTEESIKQAKPVEATGLYQIAQRMPLKGAYNVNKGYTVFKKVEVLESANGYSIVKKNSSYGLQVYDHIVLDAQSVYDGQLLYR